MEAYLRPQVLCRHYTTIIRQKKQKWLSYEDGMKLMAVDKLHAFKYV